MHSMFLVSNRCYPEVLEREELVRKLSEMVRIQLQFAELHQVPHCCLPDVGIGLRGYG